MVEVGEAGDGKEWEEGKAPKDVNDQEGEKAHYICWSNKLGFRSRSLQQKKPPAAWSIPNTKTNDKVSITIST